MVISNKVGVDIMAVQRIEHYTQQDGRRILKVILKPTKKYPNGYFYVDICFEDLVRSRSWHINPRGYVVSAIGFHNNRRKSLLHKEIAFRCLGRYPNYIDHENGLEFDNIGANLTEVTSQQNSRNKRSRGYLIGRICKSDGSQFQPKITLNEKNIRDTSVRREDEACIKQFQFESTNYSDYNYDFLKDRRGDADIVDLERKGIISTDEATFRHVMRYAENNAWYVWRFNLFDYFAEHGVPIPVYSLNKEGRMVDEYGQILCPFD